MSDASVLKAQLPNGVAVELECGGQDVALVKLAHKEGLVQPKTMLTVDGNSALDVRDQYGIVKTKKQKPGHADKLVRHLTAHRTAAVQAALTARPDVAFAVMTAKLVEEVFYGHAATASSKFAERRSTAS